MTFNNLRLENSYHVAVYPNDSAVNKIWQFPDIPTLRDRKVVAIQAKLSVIDVNTSKANNNINLAYQTANSYCFLTLIDTKGNAFIQNLPLAELITTVNQAGTSATTATGNLRNTNGMFVIKPTTIAWSKCFLSFPTATGTANLCSLFNVFYI
jgi:hypothetical protein